MNCPNCGERSLQHKIGFTKSKSQRYKCQHCEKRYTPEPKSRGYSESLRKKAIQLYVDGLNFRRIGRILSVHHQSVINWVNAYAEELPEASVPDETEST